MVKKHIEAKQKHKKTPIFIKFIGLLLIILSGLCFGLACYLNLIPNKYLLIILGVILVLDLILLFFLHKRNKLRVFGLIFASLLIILYIVGIVYEYNTFKALNKISDNSYIASENYEVIVRSDSDYQNIKALKNTNLGVLNCDEEGYQKAISDLSKTIKTNNIQKEDSYSLTDALLNNELDAFLMEESQAKILEENYANYTTKTRVLYTFMIDVKEENVTKTTDVTKDSFNILISGIDTYGKITSVSRSDVNILVTVNPQTGKMSLVDIPRDYYVQLYKKNGLKDKLTHAGIYGIDTSVKTVEKLLDVDINYYVKFNFTSVIKIVDTIGPIKVYSDQSFSSGQYDDQTNQVFTYTKGYNTLNGKATLSFCRERHAFENGDLVRGAHQEAVIEAILTKVFSPAIITKYASLMDNLSNTFITNMDETNMTNFIKKQIDTNTDWDITKMVMDGTSSMEYTYSYPRQKLYVMIPSEDAISKAKEQISNIYNNN
jgi:polyisoprenyl-teichoic acid--peptidoglycan teichoic acid transferase